MINRFLVQNIQTENVKLVSSDGFQPCFQARYWTMQYDVEDTPKQDTPRRCCMAYQILALWINSQSWP